MNGIKDISVSFICPPEQKDIADRLFCALGFAPWDESGKMPKGASLVVDLFSKSTGELTHYGCHLKAEGGEIGVFDEISRGQVPAMGGDWSAYRLSKEQVEELARKSLVVIVRGTARADSWGKALKKMNLQQDTTQSQGIELLAGARIGI